MDFLGFLNKRQGSKHTAKSRLQFVLIQDRINCSAEVLEMLKTDILKVISSYMEIDMDEVDIQISNSEENQADSNSPVLYANIPIKNLRKMSGR